MTLQKDRFCPRMLRRSVQTISQQHNASGQGYVEYINC